MVELLRSLAREDALRSCFDARGLDAVIHARHRGGDGFALWPLLNFALWHMTWIEGRDLAEVIARA